MKRGTRIITAVAVVAAAAIAVGAGSAFGMLSMPMISAVDSTSPNDPVEVVLSPSPTPSPTDAPSESPSPQPTDPPATMEPSPEPEPLLERGDKGREVRELQHRLYQIAWYATPTTGTFDDVTVKAVRGFQRKRSFEVTGEVDERTWRRLGTMTREPSDDELFNRFGPPLYQLGDSSGEVREVQARLRQIAWFFGDVSDYYGEQTAEAVRGFQAKRMIPVTGAVDQRTLDLLQGMTTEPTAADLANRRPAPSAGAPLDPRCTTGRVLCIDKSSNSLRWVVDGAVRMGVDVRFGREGMETREGQFSINAKSRDHVSSIYDTSMPFAMFFSGGQAVHYSPDFAANGYNGASHGCVNVRDYDTVAWLFDEVNVGDKVVVYWS